MSGGGLRSPSARALQRSTLVRPNDLVLETLEKELTAATRAERLVALVPDGRLTPARVLIGGAKLCSGRPVGAGRDYHLAQAVPAEIAVELGSKGHLTRNLHPKNGKDRSFVPIPSIDRSGFRIPRYAPWAGVVALFGGF